MGNMSARRYFEYKKQLRPYIEEAYRKLADEYDIIVIEGAGSPAEINLKAEDIVNMGMAKMAKAPVLLVETWTGRSIRAALRHCQAPLKMMKPT